MAKLRTIARRSFLIGSVAIVGGVAFGVYSVRKPHANPLLADLDDGEASFNPWVKISAERITLIAPHTDIGQGARSMQALLIAEEMDLDWGQFDVEPGLPAKAYFNTASADEGVPFRARDDGLVAETARGAAGALFKLLGLQLTGGSTAVPDSFDKLREAGAVARETLKLAAARKTGVAVAKLTTRAGAVWLPDGSHLRYTELAADAATIDPVRDVELRPPSTWRLLGKPTQRLDIVGKSTGTLDYGIDLHFDGMLNASVRFNPVYGKGVARMDSSEAEAMPGVRRVLPVSNGVAVVADNTWNAIQAVNRVDIDWEPADRFADNEQHWAELERSFSDERLDKEWRNDGDVAAAFADSSGQMQVEYRAPYLAHQPLEPISAVVRIDDDSADLWVAHQGPAYAQQLVADIAGLELEQVTLHNQYAGGSFGHRIEFENIRYAAEVAAALRGTAIKLTFSREEDFAHDFVRQNAIARIAGSHSNGQVDSLDVEVASPSVLSSLFGRMGLPAGGPDIQLPAGIWDAPYAIPNLRVRAYRAPEIVPTSSWRAVGASTGGFFLESALDELIVAAGADPMAERLRLCDDPAATRVLERLAEMCDWGRDLGSNRGRGLALVYSFGVYIAEVVDVSVTEAGIRIDDVYAVADVGPVLDPDNFENQVQGGIVWGLGHAMNCEIRYRNGRPEQSNFHQYAGMRLAQCPRIHVQAIDSRRAIKGIGEPPVPPAPPALANAIYAATGERLRAMPFDQFVRFA